MSALDLMQLKILYYQNITCTLFVAEEQWWGRHQGFFSSGGFCGLISDQACQMFTPVYYTKVIY